MSKDIRWEQRFANFTRALKKLSDAVTFIEKYLEEEQLNIHDENASEILDEPSHDYNLHTHTHDYKEPKAMCIKH